MNATWSLALFCFLMAAGAAYFAATSWRMGLQLFAIVAAIACPLLLVAGFFAIDAAESGRSLFSTGW